MELVNRFVCKLFYSQMFCIFLGEVGMRHDRYLTVVRMDYM